MDKDPKETFTEGKDDYFMDIDRMTNEGLGGGLVSLQNGLIDDTTEIQEEATPTMNATHQNQENK